MPKFSFKITKSTTSSLLWDIVFCSDEDRAIVIPPRSATVWGRRFNLKHTFTAPANTLPSIIPSATIASLGAKLSSNISTASLFDPPAPIWITVENNKTAEQAYVGSKAIRLHNGMVLAHIVFHAAVTPILTTIIEADDTAEEAPAAAT